MKLNNRIKGAILGIGGLGCPALLSLLKSWPKDIQLELKIVDYDVVSSSNLNRQILFTEIDIGKSKVQVAKEFISKNLTSTSFLKLETQTDKILLNNIDKLLGDCEFIIDCTDDVELKLMLNSFCLGKNKILIYGGAQGYEGITFLVSNFGICIKCVFGEFSPEESCELGGACQIGGILGPTAGLTALTQIEILLKNLFKLDKPDNLIYFITKSGDIRTIQGRRNPDCKYHL
jgi:molybdopterin/thiamine biosynthesis adenylyltransferase